jgi:phage N-6-adenine-methyltransferase
MSQPEWEDYTAQNEESSNEWATPPSLWRPFSDAVGGFDLDPASGCEPVAIAEDTYTKEDDGLSCKWYGDVWCNPPYSNPSAWLEKSVREHRTENNTDRILLLLPARTNTNYFSNNIEYADYVMFFGSKVSFMKDGNSQPDALPTPVMLMVFGEVNEQLAEVCNNKGWMVDIEKQTVSISDF